MQGQDHVVVALCARSRHQRVSDAIYEFPLALGCVAGLTGLFFLIAPLVPGIEGRQSKSELFLELLPVWGSAFALACYLLRYRVRVTAEGLEIRTLSTRIVSFSEIVDTEILRGRTRELVVYLQVGAQLHFSALLKGFEALVGQVSYRGQAVAAPQIDSPFKLAARARRDGASRRILWMVAAGATLVIAVLVVERMLQK